VRARHDYLPFGEELQAGIGGRTMAQGYNAQDDTRQRFTSKERDTESGLDFVEARYYASIQGRFTSTDPMMITGDRLMDPQEINLYNYARNNPLRFSDPTGEDINDSALDENKDYQKWKKALLSTEAGRAQWDKYANDHSVTITITMGENAGGNFGAETTPTFDESGKFTGATIVLGTDFAKRDTLDAEAYPISSKMTEGGDPGITSVDRTARAVDFLAHEFGHVEDAQKQGKDVLERENQLLAKNQQLEQRFGPQFGKTAQYAALQSQCGCNNVSDLHTQREVRAEAAVIPVMRDYYAKGAGHGSMPSRVNQAIQNYQKAHP
jgi:RHS repeat-associated protein